MTRSLLLAFALLALPAVAQTTDSTAMSDPAMAMTTDSTATDSTAAFVPDPAQARPLYDEALALGRSSNYAEALLKYEESLRHNPGFAPSAFGRAQALAQLGRLEDARSAFEEAVATARAADDSAVRTAAERGLAQVQTAIEQRDANTAAQSAAATEAQRVQAMADAITEATNLLNSDPVSPDAAQRAYDALERARQSGYDANLVAYYYAKALIALDRAAEAVPYAQSAVDAADASTDRSGLYVQLGLAQRAAGDTAAARAAFEAAQSGSWASWASHYLREMDTAAAPAD